jgi:hypothetical protein
VLNGEDRSENFAGRGSSTLRTYGSSVRVLGLGTWKGRIYKERGPAVAEGLWEGRAPVGLLDQSKGRRALI